jgi:site-specific DNA-methyltransferase (adenine-specific)
LGEKAMRWIKQYVEQIPIPQISEKEQQPFIKLVDKILKIKKETPQADTESIENQINTLVYNLYNLTPDEIKIIENETI